MVDPPDRDGRRPRGAPSGFPERDSPGVLERQVIAFVHRSLRARATPDGHDVAPGLRRRLAAVIDTPEVAGGPAGRAAGGSAGGAARSAEALLGVVNAAAGYRDRQAAHERERRWIALATSILTTLAVALAVVR